MRRFVMSVLLLTLVLVAALGGAAYADTAADNAQCLTCHSTGATGAVSKVDFGVGPVDKSTACNKCHWITGHPYHFQDSQCGGCHRQWNVGTRTSFFKSAVQTPYGYFSTLNSVNAPAATLHTIHTKRTWVAEVTEYGPACQTCHAAASCDSCHQSPTRHGTHGVNGNPAVGDPTVPVNTVTAPGVAPGTVDDVDRSVAAQNACASTACHAGPENHTVIDDLAATYSGTWTTLTHSSLAGGSVTYTNEGGAYFETTFVGTGYAWIGQRDLSGGIAEVFVDGTLRGTVDTYLTPVGYSRTVFWQEDLPLGLHTIRVVNTGRGNVNSTGTKISLQQLDVRTRQAFAATPSCASCHESYSEHYGTTRHVSSWTLTGCNMAGCHTTRDLMTVHNEHRTAAEGEFTCVGCHGNFSVALQIEQGLTGCGDCHQGISQTGSHQAAHWAQPPLYDVAPRYSYNTGSVGTAPTGDCIGCHASNLVDEHMGIKDALGNISRLPRLDSTGAPLTCDTCHGQTAGSPVQTAIVNSQSACESCHQIHGTMPEVHTSTFSANQEVPCADCHRSDLTAEHDSGYRSSAGLTGCDVCHKLFTGTLGATVQSAISVTNDTTCTACHSAAHPDAGGHSASAPASQECAVCHDEGGASQIDVRLVHATSAAGACDACHRSARLRSVAGRTAECASCHASTSTEKTYHRNLPAAHTFGGMDASCIGANCHVASTLPEEHERFVAGSAFTSTCAMCHDNPAVNLATATADCATCHTVHGDIATIHTAATPARCLTCHRTGNTLTLHVSQATGKTNCALCHNSTTTLVKPITCDSCHSPEGTDFHKEMDSKHTSTEVNSSCSIGTGCHVSALMPAEHERFAAARGFSTSCDLCHMNPAVSTAGKARSCSSCHVLHGDVDHTAKASAGCVACHETGDLLVLHKRPDGTADCAECHAAPAGRIAWATATMDCGSCHAALTPVDPNHYPPTPHQASGETACAQCHYKDMKAEHFISTVAPTVTCVSCHELKVDALPATWNKTCGTCHSVKHADQKAKHVSSSAGCGGAGCHDVGNVEVVHETLPDGGCGACHKSVSARATTTNCTASGCHASVGANHREAHNATAVIDAGCKGCHFTYIDDEHAALGLTCNTCHKSTVPAVRNAITANDLRCRTCHPTMHAAQDYEFNPKMAGGHRVSASLPGMQSSFVVNGSTYTMSVPSASSFLKTGWTTSSIVPCNGCHSYSGATGPHGATMKVNIDPAYPTNWKTAYLTSGTLGMSSNTIICAKCHDLNGTGSSFSNNVHADGDHQHPSDGQCAKCHVQVPHGWGRPRLLGSVADPAPYATLPTGLDKFRLKSYTPNGWADGDCFASCAGDHSASVGTAWPNAYGAPPVKAGSVTGTVRNSSSVAIVGASVSFAGKTATTNSSGAYTIGDVAPGTYTMSVSAAGYNTWSGPVTVAAGAATTRAVTLTAVVVTQYGNVSGTVRTGSGVAISSATVSIAGKTTTSTSAGAYSVTGIATGTYTMTVTATGYSQWTGSVTITANATTAQNVTLTAATPTATNVARLGTATASSASSSTYAASRAIDGSTSTYWRSLGGRTEWLRADLGSAKTISKVVVNWLSTSYARSYRVETSSDGSNWTSRYSTTSGDGGVDTITISAVTARYVRVYSTDSYLSDYRIAEFEVWGY